jgi:HEAT repeat protein/ATP/ADP translocase
LKLARSFQILEADRRLTFLLGLIHLLVAAAHSFFDVSSTALLIAHLGPDTLPQVYMGSAIALIFAGLVIIPVVDRLDRSKLFAVVLVVFGAGLVVASRFAGQFPDFAYRVLYVACFLMKGLVFLQFWLLAGDLLDLRQAKRLFPVLLGFSLVGGVAASLLASILPRWLPTEALLAAAGVLLLAAIAPVRLVGADLRRRRPAAAPRAPRLTDVWKGLRRDVEFSFRTPLLRTISLFILLLALLSQVLDFLLGKAAHLEFTTVDGVVALDSLTTFYAVMNAVVVGASVLVQLLLANRVISSVGVTRGELLAPVTFLGAFVAVGFVWLAGRGQIGFPFFMTLVVSKAVQKVLRISLVRTSTDLIYNAIADERRGRAKAFKETVIEPVGVLLGGLFLMASTRLPLQYVLGGAILLSVAFLASTLELKSRYMESLVHTLKEKSRFRFAFPSLVMRQADRDGMTVGVSGLKRALENDAASVRILAVEVAAELKEPEVATLLVDRFRAEIDPEVRSRMLGALGKMVRERSGGGGDEAETMADFDPRVRASGMESLAQSGIFQAEHLSPDDTAPPEAGSRAHSEPRDAADESAAPSPAKDAPAGDERRRMILEIARRPDRDALERLVHFLEEGDGATRHVAARALENCGEAAIDALTLALWSTDVEARRYVIRALGHIGGARARQALLPVLSLEAEEAYYDLVRLEAVRRLPDQPGIRLLADSIVQRVERARRNAHQVLRAVFLTEPGMRLILSNLSHPDRYVRSRAIEALELRVDATLLGGILPLFEHENPRTIAEHGGSLFSLPTRGPADVLRELTRHRSSWIRACAVYALGQVGTRDDLRTLQRVVDDRHDLVRLNAVEAIGHLGDPSAISLLQSLSQGNGRIREYAEAAIADIRERA